MSLQSLQQKLQDSLNRGATSEALNIAKSMAASGASAPWMTIAKLCQQQNDMAGEEVALTNRLNEQRGDILAISGLAELKRIQGDRRAANSYYQLGINTVAQMRNPNQSLLAWVEHAKSYLNQGDNVYLNHMIQHLDAAGIKISDTSPQMREAFDLLMGKTELYLQQPNMFFYPGLPHRAWFEREEFHWIEELESHTGAIIEELKAVIGSEDAFEPYVQGQAGRPKPNNPLLDDPSWGAGYLWKSGARQDKLADRVPSAMKALEAVPLPIIPDRSPSVIFSRLKPGTHIKPHHGMLNTRLICHLPLIVPEGCGIRVGATTREWEVGKTLIFDDSIEHEAWNRGSTDRTILLFEIWRPEISEEDREVLTALFSAINNFNENA